MLTFNWRLLVLQVYSCVFPQRSLTARAKNAPEAHGPIDLCLFARDSLVNISHSCKHSVQLWYSQNGGGFVNTPYRSTQYVGQCFQDNWAMPFRCFAIIRFYLVNYPLCVLERPLQLADPGLSKREFNKQMLAPISRPQSSKLLLEDVRINNFFALPHDDNFPASFSISSVWMHEENAFCGPVITVCQS